MKGYGLTVVRGTRIDRFDIEIIGVLKNALPRQSIILIRCAGLNLEHSGIVAGMSGSPIFVRDPDKGDLLIGALSYGFQFNKDPVAGVTPIAEMLPEMDRQLLPPPSNQRLLTADARSDAADRPARERIALPDGAVMAPVSVPLVLSGFAPGVVDAMRGAFADMGFDHVQLATGGATPAQRQASPPFEPGSAISLSLARGDMSVSGIGTITWVRGDHFIAFGHPFKGLGQVHLPVGGADIQWILASQASSFKMGNALNDIGILDQDRQPAVAGRTGVRGAMVPMHLVVRSVDRKQTQVWNVEVTDQPMFFPMIASMVAQNVAKVAEPVPESLGIELKVRFEVEGGHSPVELRDTISGLNGMAGVGDIGAMVGQVAKAITFNGFERLRVARIDVEMDVSEGRNLAFIEWVRTASEEVDVGVPIAIKVGMMRPNVDPPLVVQTLTLPPLPRELAGTAVTVQIGPEKQFGPEFPEPKSVEDILAFLRAQPSRSRLAAVIALPEPSLMLRGSRLTGLPLGVRDELQGHTVSVRTGKDTLRTVIGTPWALNGSASIKLRVRP